MGKKWETRRNSRQEMGEKWETIRNSRREMGINGIRDNTRCIIFQQKNWKNRGTNWKNRGKTLKKNRKKTGKKQEKNRKLQEMQKRYFNEVPENAENGNEFLARFRGMLKTKTKTETRSSLMSRNDDSRAKTMYRPAPRADPVQAAF